MSEREADPHRGSIVPREDGDQRATCSCGWECPVDRCSRVLAWFDHDQHLVDVGAITLVKL